jgi:hypothetical protein
MPAGEFLLSAVFFSANNGAAGRMAKARLKMVLKTE